MGAREGRRARHSVRTVILQFGKQSGMYGPMSGVGFVGSLLMFPLCGVVDTNKLWFRAVAVLTRPGNRDDVIRSIRLRVERTKWCAAMGENARQRARECDPGINTWARPSRPSRRYNTKIAATVGHARTNPPVRQVFRDIWIHGSGWIREFDRDFSVVCSVVDSHQLWHRDHHTGDNGPGADG
jgi:hypothetical protein